jgi:bacteriocin biosynthesis cyclodehydratase domain-containing protein
MSKDSSVRIKRKFSLVVHGPDTVEIRHGVWNPVSFVLNDESKTGNLFRLLQRLDGTCTPAALARELGLPREQVEAVIDHVDQIGVLESGPENLLDYYLDSVVPTLAAAKPPEPRRIILMGEDSIIAAVGQQIKEVQPDAEVVPADAEARRIVFDDNVSWMYDGMEFHGKIQSFAAWKDSLVLLASSVINPLHYKVLNRASLEYGFPWLHAAIDGPFLLVGPTFVPRRSACYECFERRILMNFRDGASYVAYKEALVNRQIKHGKMPIDPMLRAMLASHTAMEIVNFVNTGASFVLGKCLSIFLPTMEFAYNEVLRVPGCPACAPVAERDDTELYFNMATLIHG